MNVPDSITCKRSALLSAALLLAFNQTPAEELLLDPLSISFTKAEMAPEDVKASFSVVTAEEIRQSGAQDVFQAIRRTTGVTSGGGSSSIAGRKSILIRGMESSHVLMLVDGRRLTNTDSQIGHSNFQLNAIPMDAIERIEIVRGPMSSLYGSAGMAGVINIITKKAGKAWHSSVDLIVGTIDEGEGGDEYRASLSTSGPIGDAAGLRLVLETSDVEVTPDKDGVEDTEIEGKEIDSVSAGLFYDITDDHRVRFDLDRSNEDRIRDIPYYEIEKHQYALGYQGQLAGVEIDAKAYESYSENYLVDSRAPYRHYLTDQVFSVDLVKDLTPSNQLIAGIEYRKEDYEKEYDSPTQTGFMDDVDSTSLFVQDDIGLMEDQLGITLGARYDDHERFGGEFSPKLYLEYKVNPDQRIGFGYGHAFKAPTLTQNSDSYVAYHGTTRVFNGNSELKPETSDSYELVWEYDDGDNQLRSALFHNDITDLIDSTRLSGSGDSSDPYIYQYTNIHEAVTQGLELEFSRALTDSLFLAVNLTRMCTEDGEYDGKALKRRPELFGNLNLSHHYDPWGLYTTLNWEYIGKQYMQPDEEDQVPSYSLLDLTFSKEFSKLLELRGGIANIADTRLADKSDNFDQEEERGRFYFVGLRLSI
jgi:outer membrane receptor for ferrienterochelin and colicins